MARILTVDDSESIRFIVRYTLESHGHEVLEAASCQEALELLESDESNYVDIVLTDLNMTTMDGIELTRRLRALPGFEKTPILLLSVEKSEDRRNEAVAAGISGWLVKPFSEERLVRIISDFLEVAP